MTAPRVPRGDAAGSSAVRARGTGRTVPEATVARLATYLRVLEHARPTASVTTVSSEELATAAGVNSAKLRKDLSYLGSYGIRGVGYDVDHAHRADLADARAHRAPLGRADRRRQPGPGARRLRRLRHPRLPDRRAARRRPGADRHDDPRPAGARHRRPRARSSPSNASPSPCSPCRPRSRRTSATGSSAPASRASSTSRRSCCRCRAHVDLRKVDLAAELQILSFHETPQGRGRADLAGRAAPA